MNRDDNKHETDGAVLTAWMPDLLYTGGRFRRDMALVSDGEGRIVDVVDVPEELFESIGGEAHSMAFPARGIVVATRFVRLRNRALLPGLVNSHSHAFQRVIRGRTEYASSARAASDSFWTWREMMYSAAARLTPEDIYDASRMAFLEMALGGITSVGEFHYLHRTPQGTPYDDPNLLAKEVVRAARDVGLRIALLRVAYARAGYNVAPNERQTRFIESDADTYLRHVERLHDDITAEQTPSVVSPFDYEIAAAHGAWVGVAPHSVRAVPLEYLRAVCAFADERGLPVHMHVAEQPAEVAACLDEYGRTPVVLLADEGLLSERFTGVHAVHITPAEARALAVARACVCACPTTERNLGDGIVPADLLFREGVALSLGTDSHTQIDLLEDARELEYHLRLQRLARNVLAPVADANEKTGSTRGNGATNGATNANHEDTSDAETQLSSLAARLFECATVGGARSIGVPAGEFATGRPADFFTVNLHDPSIAGAAAEDLLPSILFSLARTAIREVAVGGRLVVEDGAHPSASEIVTRFNALQRRLWHASGDDH
ncbi:MAG TPA: formimidoylglutamate deiminase [Pyrinomonadaceae bacterium]